MNRKKVKQIRKMVAGIPPQELRLETVKRIQKVDADGAPLEVEERKQAAYPLHSRQRVLRDAKRRLAK
jgi:hypothetical protein